MLIRYPPHSKSQWKKLGQLSFEQEDLSFDKKISVEYVQTKIVPSKAVVGVDRPMKAPSMHIQKPNKGKIV